jgi:iron(III) transport system substrate-binding protein
MVRAPSRRWAIGGCAALAAWLCVGASRAGDTYVATEADIPAEARREGTLTLYSSAPTEDTGALIAAFETKYGVKVRLWRGGSEAILTRTVNESRGGRVEADVIETAGPEMEALTREKLLDPMGWPKAADRAPAWPEGTWIATRYSVFAAAYNTGAVAAADVPHRYEDLLDPKWKGRLGVEADDVDWFFAVVGALGERKGLDLFGDIVARNGVSIRKGHSLLTNLVVSGEVPLALTAYGYRVDRLKKAGAPIDKSYLPPVIALPTGVAPLRKAPHPFAAMLFVNFMLTDGQAIMADRGFVTRRNLSTMPVELTLIDSAKLLDEREKWTRLYKETFAARAR